MKLVDVTAVHVEASTGEPIVLLQEHDEPHRLLPIWIGGAEALAIALALSDQDAPRPLTHDLLAEVITTLGAQVEQVEVTEIQDSAFVAQLAVSGPAGTCTLEARRRMGSPWPCASTLRSM